MAAASKSTSAGERLAQHTVSVFRRHDNQDTATCPPTASIAASNCRNSTLRVPAHPDLMPVRQRQRPALRGRHRAVAELQPVRASAAAFAFRFPDPVLKTGLPGPSTCQRREQWWTYDAPDPSSIPGQALSERHDRELSCLRAVRRSHDPSAFPAAASCGSSVPNYAFANNSFMFGVSWRF